MNSKNLLVILFVLTCAGCNNVVPNVEVCADIGRDGAVCSHTLNGPERDISRRQWDRERFGQFCMMPESFAKYQKFIERACQNNKCVREAYEELMKFKQRMARRGVRINK